MKRNRDKITPKSESTTGDIKKDLSASQLAAIGAVALAYNEVEAVLDEIFYGFSGVSDEMRLEISTRLNIESKVEIIMTGIKTIGLDGDDLQELLDVLGENVFVKLKTIRNSIIHARVVNASVGIGLMVDKKAKIKEVLLDAAALEILYKHLIALRDQLGAAQTFLWGERSRQYFIQNLAADDPGRARLEADRANWIIPFHAHRDVRRVLPPLPEFPSESEVREAEAKWFQERRAEQMGWLQSHWPAPLPSRNNALLDTYYPAWVPQPPPEEKK